MCLWQGSKKAVKPAHASHVAEIEVSSEVGHHPIDDSLFCCLLVRGACSLMMSTIMSWPAHDGSTCWSCSSCATDQHSTAAYWTAAANNLLCAS